MDEMKYSAFISYRHGELDEFVAKNIHKQLESYKLPKALAEKTGKKTVGRIFRDVDELPTSDSLYSNIEEALGQSAYLIVICTPRLLESKWCMREIELFTQMRGPEHVLVVLAKGEPSESFPEIFLHREIHGEMVDVEPLAADVRGDNEGQIKKRIHSERLRLIAAIIDCEFDDLRQRARQREMRQRTAVFGGAFAVAIAFLGMMGMENRKLQNQVQETLKSQSYLLSQYATDSYKGDDPMTAALLSLEGIPKNLDNSRPFVGDAMASLTTALQTYNYQKGYVADHTVSTRTVDSSFISLDGSYMAYVDLNNQKHYFATFYDTQKNRKVKSFPMNEDMCNETSSEVKVVFFGDHYSAIAGLEAMQVIDLDTMEIIWTGEVGTGVNVSKDERVLVSYDFDTNQVVFYDIQKKKVISRHTWDCTSSAALGFNEDGSLYAMQVVDEDGGKDIQMVDTATGEITASMKTLLNATPEEQLEAASGNYSWDGNTFLFSIKKADEESEYYAAYHHGEELVTRTSIPAGTDMIRLDEQTGEIYYLDGTDLTKVDLATGKDEVKYQSGGSITTAVYCQEGMFEILCSDGSMEYVDFNETPYCVSRQEGDGTGFTMAHVGGDYLVADLTNSYKVSIYRLNNKTAGKASALNRKDGSVMAYLLRNDNLICLNSSNDTYTINTDTLQVITYEDPVSYLELGNSNTVLLNDLEGNYVAYDAATGQEKSRISDEVSYLDRAAYLVDDKKHEVNGYDYDSGKIIETYPIPDNCVSAIRSKDRIVCTLEEDGKQYVEICDLEGNSKNKYQSDNILTSDYFLGFEDADTGETIFYDLDTDQIQFQGDYGDVDWCMQSDDRKYLFLSTIDQGGYILDGKTGETVLTMTEVSTLYNLTSYEGSPYFSLLYIANGGSTRLDIYEKEHPESPIARIPGGIGINEEDQVIIYDGAKKVYETPILSEQEIYEQALTYVGDNTLTEKQKENYHCK